MLSLILNLHVRILVPFLRANYLYERPEVHLDQKYILWASKDQWTHSTKIWVSYILGMVPRTYIISFKSQEDPCEIITVSIFQMKWRDFPQGMPASKNTATGGFVMSRPTWWAEQHFPEFSSLCVFIAVVGVGLQKTFCVQLGREGWSQSPVVVYTQQDYARHPGAVGVHLRRLLAGPASPELLFSRPRCSRCDLALWQRVLYLLSQDTTSSNLEPGGELTSVPLCLCGFVCPPSTHFTYSFFSFLLPALWTSGSSVRKQEDSFTETV